MIVHGILAGVSYQTLFDECTDIRKSDLGAGYVEPKPLFRPYKKKYYPPKEDPGRAPITGRGPAARNKRWT